MGTVRDYLAEERRRAGSSSPWEGEGGGGGSDSNCVDGSPAASGDNRLRGEGAGCSRGQ
jgi:hypothetical protein